MKTVKKIIHLTDVHLNPLTHIPRACKENYHEIVYAEFLELKKRIQHLKDEAIIAVTGDIFNLKTQSLYTPKNINYYVNFFQDIFQGFQVYTIPGNHDLPKSSFSLIQETVYKSVTFSATNVFCIANHSKEFDNVTLHGFPYTDLNTFTNNLVNTRFKSNTINVVLSHQDIFENDISKHFGIESMLTFEQVANLRPNLDICLLGHIHKEVTPIKVKDTLFSKPHAFSRMAKSYLKETEVKDSYPAFNIIDLETMTIKTERIDLFKAEELLDFDIIAEIKQKSDNFSFFLEELRNSKATNFQIMDADKALDNIEMKQEVRDIVDNYLEKVDIK